MSIGCMALGGNELIKQLHAQNPGIQSVLCLETLLLMTFFLIHNNYLKSRNIPRHFTHKNWQCGN